MASGFVKIAMDEFYSHNPNNLTGLVQRYWMMVEDDVAGKIPISNYVHFCCCCWFSSQMAKASVEWILCVFLDNWARSSLALKSDVLLCGKIRLWRLRYNYHGVWWNFGNSVQIVHLAQNASEANSLGLHQRSIFLAFSRLVCSEMGTILILAAMSQFVQNFGDAYGREKRVTYKIEKIRRLNFCSSALACTLSSSVHFCLFVQLSGWFLLLVGM